MSNISIKLKIILLSCALLTLSPFPLFYHCPLTHSLTHSLIHSFTHSLTHSLILSLSLSLSLSLTLTLSPYFSHSHSLPLSLFTLYLTQSKNGHRRTLKCKHGCTPRTILKNSLNSFCIGVPESKILFFAGRAFNALVRPASAFFNLWAWGNGGGKGKKSNKMRERNGRCGKKAMKKM